MNTDGRASLARRLLLDGWKPVESFFEYEEGDQVVVAAVNEGAIDLDFMLRLEERSASVWRAICQGLPPSNLEHDDRGSPKSYGPNDRELVEHLRAHGLISGGVDEEASSAGAHRRQSRLDAESVGSGVRPDFIALIRKAFADGLKLRFRAQGRSMRPFVPSGSQLECVPCTLSELRPGMVALYTLPDYPLVAHRVASISASGFVAKGDSAGRIDQVAQADLLGMVSERIVAEGRRKRLSTGWRRFAGRWSGRLYRSLRSTWGFLIARPFRRSMKRRSLTRRFLAFLLKVCSGLSRRMENLCFRWRSRFDVWRAATLSSEEKDREREKLYARKSVVEFTAREENVEAGLTLIEEVLINRVQLSPSRCLVLGCGPGRESVALAKLGHTVMGLERDPSMLIHARELAERHGVSIEFVEGNCVDFEISRSFDVVVIFSGLINMVMPRSERVRMLEACRKHLEPAGRVLLTFLSDYEVPGQAGSARSGGLLPAMNPDHQAGDRFLLNECVHLYPSTEGLLGEAREAGLEVESVHRDQRAYHRQRGQVRGFAVLRNPA